MLNSSEQSQGMATSIISEADERMSLSSTDSFEKITPRLHISNPRALDTSASSEILLTPPPTGIRFLPSAPQAQPPCPSDPKVVKNIEVLAAFVAKNGPQFEDMARQKQAKDPKFQFLFGGEAGSEASVAYNFYEWKKGQLLSQERTSSLQEHQKLNPESRDRSELLQSDSRRRLSSDASEMHNDDIDQILPSPQPKPVKAQDSFSSSTSRVDGDHFEQQEQRLHLDGFTMSRDINYSTPRRRDTRRRTGFDRQSMKDVDTLPDLLRPIQDNLSPAVDKEERPLVFDDPDIETSARCSESREQRKSAEMILRMEEKQSSHRFSDEKEDLQIPQVESFSHFDANLYHKRNEPTRDAERSARTMHIGRPKVHHPMKNAQSGPHTIDEFGRLVRQGVNDSDSDEDRNSFRKRRRSASGSRSRSPGGSRRKRQSPSWSPRWRGNYHASYSRSPKQHRSHSPTPPWEMKRGSDWRGDQGSFGRGRRGGRRGGPAPPCYDFSRGRCFRGSSCRFIHQDTHMTFGDSSEKTLGGIRAHRRRDNFMEHEGTYILKDESWPSVGRGAASRTQKVADVTGGEGWSWPNNGIGGSKSQNDGFKIHEGFSTHDPESTAISESVSAAFSAETSVLNTPKPSCSASLSDDSQIALSPCSWGTNTKSQPASVQAAYLSTFASQQTSPLPSAPKVSFHQHQTLPFLPPPPFPPPPPPPHLPPPPPRLPPPPPTQIASFSPPTRAPGVPASLPVADQLSEQTPIFSGRLFTSKVPVSWNSLSQQPVAAVAVGAPPASMSAASGMLSLHQHATNATLLSAQTGVAVPALHDSVSTSLSEQPRLPSPTPASQVPFNNAFSQQQGFAPPSSSPPQYVPGAGKQQEIAPSYPTSFSGMVSHQQKDGAYLPLSKHSTLARNPPQQVLSHQFINSIDSEKTEITTTHSRPISEYPLTSQHLSTPDMMNLSGGACTQAFTSASGAASVTHNPRGSSESGMDVLPQSNSTGMPSSSLTHNNYLAESVEPEPAGGDLRSQSLGASFDQAVPSLMRSSLGIKLKLSGVDMEPVCPEEPMSPGPAVGGMQSVNPEPPSDLVMESVSPGLPVRVIPPDMEKTQSVTHLTGNSAVENDSSTLEIKNNSPDNVEAHAVEHAVERANLNLEDGQDRMKKDKEGKPVMLLRVAVTEYVKEVLKPTWKEGHMSKEAFKTIAKKAVDKVLGTLQSHQVPKTQDKVDHFMSFSRPKIANLVQGYVEKYVKIT